MILKNSNFRRSLQFSRSLDVDASTEPWDTFQQVLLAGAADSCGFHRNSRFGPFSWAIAHAPGRFSVPGPISAASASHARPRSRGHLTWFPWSFEHISGPFRGVSGPVSPDHGITEKTWNLRVLRIRKNPGKIQVSISYYTSISYKISESIVPRGRRNRKTKFSRVAGK